MSDETRGGGVLCIGSFMVDIICSVDSLPVSGGGVVSRSTAMRLGGCAYNSAVAARQSGAAVVLAAPLGKGPYASFARVELAVRGFQVFDANVAGDNGAVLCMVEPDGERTMVTIPGVERRISRDWLEGVDISECLFAEFCGYEACSESGGAIMAFLEEHPCLQVVFAPGPVVADVPEAMVARINALHPIWHLNEREVLALTGCSDVFAAGRALSLDCGNVVVVTAGADGSYAFAADWSEHVPTRAVEVVDTVGAGDSHLGALLARRAAGDGWREALGFANRVSGAVCSVAGPTLDDGQIAHVLEELRAH